MGATYQKDKRLQRLNDIRLNLHTIMFLLRTSQETDCMSMGLYEHFAREIDEMGKMSSSWIKAELKKEEISPRPDANWKPLSAQSPLS